MEIFFATVECLNSPNQTNMSVRHIKSPCLQLKTLSVNQNHWYDWGTWEKFRISGLVSDLVNEFLPVCRIPLVHMLIKIWGVLDKGMLRGRVKHHKNPILTHLKESECPVFYANIKRKELGMGICSTGRIYIYISFIYNPYDIALLLYIENKYYFYSLTLKWYLNFIIPITVQG